MEEIQAIKKIHHIPKELKQKRKLFNNKRFHTMPSDIQKQKFVMNETRKQSITHRTSSQFQHCLRLKLRQENCAKSRTKFGKKGGRLQFFWENYHQTNELKTCQAKFRGYEKRKVRLEENNHMIDSFFRNTEKFHETKDELLKNISVISKVLRDSFPRMKIDYKQFDDCLVMENNQYNLLFSTTTRKIR